MYARASLPLPLPLLLARALALAAASTQLQALLLPAPLRQEAPVARPLLLLLLPLLELYDDSDIALRDTSAMYLS